MRKKNKLLCAALATFACLLSVGIGLKSVSAEEKFELSVSMSKMYTRGSYFTIPTAELRLNGETCKATHTLVAPNGDVFTGETTQLTNLGEYTLTYKADIAGKTYTETYSFTVENAMSSMFSYGRNVTAEDNAELPSYIDKETHVGSTEGVRFTMKNGEDNTIRYNDVIDLNELGYTKHNSADWSTAFVEFMFTPDSNQSKETNEFRITLTDVYDESNYLTIDMIAGDAVSIYPGSFYTGAAPKDMYVPKGWLLGSEVYSDRGTSVSTSMYGSITGDISRTCSYFFDVEETELWVSQVNRNYNWINFPMMAAFKDPEVVGPNKVWDGFTTGEVYLTFEIPSMNMPQTSFTVFSIAGKTCADDYSTIGDIEIVPYYGEFDIENDYIVAGEGYSFNVFAADAFSDKYGKIEDVSAKVYYGADKATEISCINGKFDVKEPGVYSIIYTAKASFGEAVKEIALTAKDAYDIDDALRFEILPSVAENVGLGDTVYLYNGLYDGGIGTVVCSHEVKLNGDNVPVSYTGKYPSFLANNVGDYEVKYILSDELGDEYIQSFTVRVSYDEKPRLMLPTIANAYMVGHSYVFPLATGSYYGETGEKDVNISVLVNGEDYTNKPYKVEGDFTLTYKATLVDNPSVVAEQSIQCTGKVKDVSKDAYLSSYFTLDSFTALPNEESLVFTTSSMNNAATFVTKIPMEMLKFITKPVGDKNAYDGIEFTITDSVNPQQTVKISVRNQIVNGNAYASFYIGEEFSSFTKGAFDGSSSDPFLLEYDKTKYTFTDGGNTVVGTLTNFENGDEFKGFTSGYVYVSMRLMNVTGESAFELRSLAGQAFSIYVESDTKAPEILGLEQLSISSYAVLNDTFTVPKAFAFDALSEVKTLTLTVKNPIGGIIYEGDSSQEYTFKLDASGRYTVQYYVEDTSGAKQTRTFYVFAKEKQPPVIELSQIKTTASINKEYKLAVATVTDDLSGVEYVKYVTDSTGRNYFVEGDFFTFTTKGKWTVNYYAWDGYSNFTLKSYTVEVK